MTWLESDVIWLHSTVSWPSCKVKSQANGHCTALNESQRRTISLIIVIKTTDLLVLKTCCYVTINFLRNQLRGSTIRNWEPSQDEPVSRHKLHYVTSTTAICWSQLITHYSLVVDISEKLVNTISYNNNKATCVMTSTTESLTSPQWRHQLRWSVRYWDKAGWNTSRKR